MKLRFLPSFLLAAFICSVSQKTAAQTITTFAGCGIGDDSLATKAEVFSPMRAIVDNAGNTYIADNGSSLIRKVDVSGVITTYAGNGIYGYSGDGSPATAASLGAIYSLAFDKTGNLLMVDGSYNVVRKINSSGVISTIAGNGIAGYGGDGGSAISAELNGPSDIAVDTAGNIYIADRNNYLVRKINISGTITSVAGNGTTGTTTFGGPAVGTSVGFPFRIATDNKGNLFIGSYYQWYIMKVDNAGILTNIAGTGVYGFSGDGGPATAATFSAPCGLAVDTSTGNVYFSDINAGRIRMIDATTGVISTAAGTSTVGYSGDGGPATAAELSDPEQISFDGNGNLYIADIANNRVRKVTPAGIISTFAGQNGLFGEGYPATNAEISSVQNLTTDAAGNVYIADIDNQRIRMISAATGKITTVAGGGISGYDDAFSGDGGAATDAHLYYPSALVVDPLGNMFICDQDNQRIRKVTASGVISTIAGNGTAGYAGNGTLAVTAEFDYPTGIAIDAAGNLYICDNNNQIIRKINGDGIITTIAGNRVAGYNGDGIPATSAELDYPSDVAVDAIGNVYISDQGNSRIRIVDTTGIINTYAGNGTPGNVGDAGLAHAAEIAFPEGIKLDHAGNLFIADHGNNSVRMVTTDGIIATIAGSGIKGFSGDGGPSLAASLNSPSGVAVDGSDNVYIADGGNHRVRKVAPGHVSVPSVRSGAQNIFVYPNPTTGIINIANAPNSLLIVNDITGKEVMRKQLATAEETIDIHSLASGVYLFLITGKNGDAKTVKVTRE